MMLRAVSAICAPLVGKRPSRGHLHAVGLVGGVWAEREDRVPAAADRAEDQLGAVCLDEGEVPVDRCPADAEVLGDVLAGVPVGLHPPGGRDVLRRASPSILGRRASLPPTTYSSSGTLMSHLRPMTAVRPSSRVMVLSPFHPSGWAVTAPQANTRVRLGSPESWRRYSPLCAVWDRAGPRAVADSL